jgi:hypothetical protein
MGGHVPVCIWPQKVGKGGNWRHPHCYAADLLNNHITKKHATVVHDLLEGGLLMLIVDPSLEEFYLENALVYPISDLTRGSGFD